MKEETGCDPGTGTCIIDSAEASTAASMIQMHRQVKERHSHLRRAICFDDDANLRSAAARVNQTVKGCADVAEHCDHPEWGEGIMFLCPETCGLCNNCVDDDANLKKVAAIYNITLTGCSDQMVVDHCDDPYANHGLGQLCPETCGACTCDDDDDNLIFHACEMGITLSGCSEVKDHCDDLEWGGGIAHFCPKTCGLCTVGGGGPGPEPGSKPGPSP